MFNENVDKARILITDDEPPIRNLLRQLLGIRYECVEAGSAEEALTLLRQEKFDVIISDVLMGGISGLDLIPYVREIAPDISIIMISGVRNIENAIKAMRAGAFDYITKPFDFDHVETVVSRALEHQSLLLAKRNYDHHLEEMVNARTLEWRREMVERQRAEEKINRMAYYDALTNLPNPSLFKDRVTHELSKSGEIGKTSALIFLALDRFKNVSDTLGHHVGEELLSRFAGRLAECIRKTDTAAYFGGSEFALLATEIGSAEDCAKIAEKIKSCLLIPFNCGGQELYITASFGISLAPNDGRDCQTLLKNASTALCRAHQSGGGDYRFYTAEMNERALKSLSLENSLRRGLERGEFVLHYQPQLCAATGEFTGTEALVRWRHPELGMVPPLDFIPIAEETGLIVPLGEWILQTACEQNAAWQRAGFPPVSVAVNLSPRQFQQSDLVESVSRVLHRARLEPKYLELELTESLLMNNSTLAIETLLRLRNLGIKISIDDFGSGYSSLAYLKNLPIDALKIDRSFVNDIAANSKDAAIVKTIITLAHDLGLITIAEGVETEEQSMMLLDFGCDLLQGYLFSKPLAADQLESFVSARCSDTSLELVAAPSPVGVF